MADAFIFDAVRTPRGKGREGGALNAVSPVDLQKTLIDAVLKRNSVEPARGIQRCYPRLRHPGRPTGWQHCQSRSTPFGTAGKCSGPDDKSLWHLGPRRHIRRRRHWHGNDN